MPAPSWIDRIPRILNALEQQATFSRQDVQIIFGLGKSAAVDLMRVVGATPGPVPTVTRAALLAYVENGPASQELARRKKLAVRLKAAEDDLKFRKVRLRVTEEEDGCVFADLPNVSIQPGLVQVAFTPGDPVDVLDTLFRFVKAVGNDWEGFERMCKDNSRAAPCDLGGPGCVAGAYEVVPEPPLPPEAV